jgi:hypothetical protein
MNAIVASVSPMPLQDMRVLADAIAKSNLFGIRTPEQALVLMAIAQAEGRHPVEAARDYDIINNRPAKKAEAMMRDFILAGGKIQWNSLTDELADATFSHPQTGEVRISWDMKRAQTAFGKKDMYSKFPRQMLRSRVVSEGVRTLWPLATSGMYEPGEAADIAPEHNGPTVEHDAREAINAAVPLRAAAADMPRGARVAERAPAYEAPPEPRTSVTRSDDQWRAWLLKLGDACKTLYRREEVVQVGERASVGDALANGPPWVQREVSAILAANYARFPEEAAVDADPFGEVEINGEAKLAAG